MNHYCQNFWINIAGGEVHCECCHKDSFFTDLGISAEEIISAGGYDELEKDGSIPEHDLGMIQYFYECEKEFLERFI